MFPAASFDDEALWSARTTPHLFPDGTPVRVHVAFGPTGADVSDRGETLKYVGDCAAGRLLPPRLRAQVVSVCRIEDVALEAGAFRVHVPPGGDVSEAVERMARLAERIAHLVS